MERTPTPRDKELSIRELLGEARQIAYRLIGIVEVLEHELGMNEGEGNDG